MTVQHLPPDLAARWASSAQFRFLDALMADPALACDQIAFHGGTSLHSWRSPRRSEDLDFLTALTSEVIRAAVERAHKKAVEAFLAENPRFILELRDKTRCCGIPEDSRPHGRQWPRLRAGRRGARVCAASLRMPARRNAAR